MKYLNNNPYFISVILALVLMSCNMDVITDLEKKMKEQDDKISQLEKEQRESTNGQLSARISQVETAITTLQTSSTSAEADRQTVRQKISTLETELATLKTAQANAASKTELQALLTRVTSLETKTADMQKEIDALKSANTGTTGTKSAEQLKQELLVAIRYSSPSIANALLDAGADPDSKYDDNGTPRVALILAVENDLKTVVQKLIDKKVDITPAPSDAVAKEYSSRYVPLFGVRSEAVYDSLVAAGADINFKNTRGETFLFGRAGSDGGTFKASEFGAILPKAVAKGMDINVKNTDKITLLSEFLRSTYVPESLGKIKAILKISSLEINAVTSYNQYTALQQMASGSFTYDKFRETVAEIVTDLLAVTGIEVNKKTSSAKTALDLLDQAYCGSSDTACTTKKAEVKKLLTDAGAKLAADVP